MTPRMTQRSPAAMKFWSVLLACALLLASVDVEAARRLGGGRSIGRQSANVTQREAQRAPVSPAPGQAPQQSPAVSPASRPNAATTPAAAPRRPWGGILGGLAAGLGLAWLAHSLGLGPQFAQFLLFALLALVLMAIVGFVMRGRRTGPGAREYAFQGAAAPAEPRQYSPDKVGNDASARPWEQGALPPQPVAPGGLQIGSALAGPQGWGIPAGFDAAGFIESAKRNFITLQSAWDRADVATLRAMMSDEMLGEMRQQLKDREQQPGGQPQRTDVVLLEAQLLGIEELADAWMASVEFSGLIREQESAGPSPFREVWNMTKPRDNSSGWLVAGVQPLQ